MSLKDRLIKNSRSKLTTTLSKSKLFNEKSFSRTKVPILNIALSGSVKGGLQSGLTILAGPSKHFKSNLGLTLVAAYLDKHEDAVCLFYDSEFGITTEYMKSFGIDPDRVIHVPIANLEELKTDLSTQMDAIERGEKVIVFIDSIGNTGSKKEADDAIEKGESKSDFTRAKEMKSLFRIVTPHFTLKDIPCVAINHTIETIAMFSQTVMTGGCVVEGTKITMADGSLKEIQDIKVGELVKTMTGSDEVTHIWNPVTLENGTPECIELTFDDGYSVITSDNHKFLCSIGDQYQWVEAKDLTTEHDIVNIESKVKLVKKVNLGKLPVYDLSVKDKEQYILENGIVSHNTGLMYSSDNVIFIGRRQIKEGTEITGYNFVLNTEKSRMVKEKSKFFLEVTFDGGIDRFSGLLEIGLELGYIIKPKNGWYQPAFLNEETGEIAPLEDSKSYREKQTKSSDKASMEFWGPLLKHEPFLTAIENRYKLSEMVSQQDIDDEIENMLE